MNEIKKLSDLAVYLKQAADTYYQRDYGSYFRNCAPDMRIR